MQQQQLPNDPTACPPAARYEELKWNAEPLYCPQQSSLALLEIPHNINTSLPASASASLTAPPIEKHKVLLPRRIHAPINAGTTALLIVDVQPEYWSACPSVRKDFPRFEQNFARALETARQQRCKIIWVRADYRRETSPWLAQFERLSKNERPDARMELPCDPEDEEFGWEDFATPEGGETIITKSSWSSTSKTALMDILRASAIDTVLVCGLITSVCVQHSAFGVFEAGYRTLLVEDACGDRGRARHEAALALYGGYMYELITSEELADPVRGMRMAKPVWITMNDVKAKSDHVVSRDSSTGSLLDAAGAGGSLIVDSAIVGTERNKKKRKVSADTTVLNEQVLHCIDIDRSTCSGAEEVEHQSIHDGSKKDAANQIETDSIIIVTA